MDLKKKRLFLLDMDGTIYIDDQLFDGTLDFLDYVNKIGGRYLFLTNNSSRGVDAYLEKLRRIGIPAKAEDLLTSVHALIRALKQRYGPNDLLYAFGTASFQRQLRQAGLRITTRLEAQVKALVVGFDTELTFLKLEDACILLNRGVDFIAANPDWVCPTWYGFVPDCGSVCQMLTRATGREPLFIGKPRPDMVYMALERTGFSAEQTVVIGDRLYTDIACGLNAGVDSILVLSGETTLEQAQQSEIQPTAIFPDILSILHELEDAK